MITLDEILAPLGREAFFRDHYRKQPVYLPAAPGRADIFSVASLNSILSQANLWTDRTLRMWADCKPVHPDNYMAAALSIAGEVRRPDPAKVLETFSRGASLVLNETDYLTPSLRAVANCLEQELLGIASANVYCSPGGRQAFDSHYDDHEVFAFHISGEKRWRVYEGRIDNPVGQPAPRANLQQMHDQSKGKVLFEQVMKPGDLIYLPRGQYHDAFASTQFSLHVTFSVIPMNGLALFSVMEKAAIRDSLFRDDLPNPQAGDGKQQLRARLSELALRLTALIESESFAEQVAAAQRQRIRVRHEADLGGNEEGKGGKGD